MIPQLLGARFVMNCIASRKILWLAFPAVLAFAIHNANAQCNAPAAWFPHAQTPEPDFHQPGSNCEFHEWAWQEFLWLTQPTGNGRIRLLDMPTEDSLFSPGRAPAPLASAMMQERLKRQPLRLMPRTRKTVGPTSIGDIRQAGSNGVLVDKSGQPVFFASFVTPVFYEFVRTNKLYLKPNYIAAADTLNFPTKAVELKSSWMVVPNGAAASGFFTTKATIPKLKCADNSTDCTGTNVVVDMTQQVEVTVALVGLHVVGVLEGHPEFVWSTFEHIDNAPDLPPGMAPNAAVAVSNMNSTFYTSGTFANACNLPNAGSVALNSSTQKLSPITNVFRQFAFGGGDAADTANITNLNQSVHGQLLADSVWKNYMLVGGVWFANGGDLVPGLGGNTIQPLVVGSVQVSNSTMETFTQKPFGSPSRSNCFSCHNTRPSTGLPAKNLNLSHILKQGLIEREQFEQLANLNLTSKHALALSSRGVSLEDVVVMRTLKFTALPEKGAPLQSYADVQKCLDTFVEENGVPIGFSPHGAFWQTMTYEQFVQDNIPGVSDPGTGMPLKVLIIKDGDHSNLVMALRGTIGTIFDPNSGSIGRMPPSGPFMTDNDIQRIVDWINAGAPK